MFLFLVGLLFPAFAQHAQVIVSAAASLTDVLTALKPAAEASIGARILFNFGGSGALRRQIEEGAPVDVFFSAAAGDMDKVEAEGLVDSASRRDILSNAMVLIGDAGTPLDDVAQLRTLLSRAEFLAIGNPDSVPAGRYAVQALGTYGLYSIVEKKLVLGGTVREVLQFVESGSAPLGIVFVTDARAVRAGSPVRQLYVFPDSALKTPIRYPVAVVSASQRRDAAMRLVGFFQGPAAREAFEKAGFTARKE